jgi:hypothetical protein
MVHGGGRGNEQALTAAKESGLRSPVRTSTFNFPHHRFRITANCIIIAQILHFSLFFQGQFCKLPLIRVIFNRNLGDYYAIRITANVVSLSDVYADDELLNKPTEMRTVRTNMLSNPLQQLYVWHLEHRLRELGERQEANPPEP